MLFCSHGSLEIASYKEVEGGVGGVKRKAKKGQTSNP